LLELCQNRPIEKVSYWYLQLEDKSTSVHLANTKVKEEEIGNIAKEISLARKLERFKCPYDGCRFCKPYEKILTQEAEYVFTDDRNKDIFIPVNSLSPEYESEIL
jgi:hypothetical protein